MIKFLFLFGFLLFSVSTSFAHGTSLTLIPSGSNYHENENFSVQVLLDTADHETVGTDLLVKFDPKSLELVSITPGKLYPTYLPASIDNAQGEGAISGVVEPQETYIGSGIFASLQFKAIGAGNTSVSIISEPNGRNDSNIASLDGKDVLDATNTAEFTIAKLGFFEKIVSFVKGLLQIR